MAKPKSAVAWRDDPARVRPMLATVTTDPPDRDLQNPAFVYEPKYDGIRALVALEPGQPLPAVRIWSRLGNDKTNQFPEVVKGLKDFAKRLRVPVVLDGEIVALDHRGEPTGFQQLQGRMHLTGAGDIDREAKLQKAAIIVFDMLREGADDLRPLPLADRRARLERLFGASGSSIVRHGEFAAGDGRRLFRQAQAEGWEGLVAKRAESPYESGRRSPNWRKLKLQHQEELIIGGWTEPRDTRQHFGALLLGAYQPGTHRLRYVGHAGTGFTEKELARVHALLEARGIDACPFAMKPPSNEKPHWARPELVAQVRFTEWTNEGLLRHPVYLGLRDDVDPKTIALVPGKTSRRPVDNAATGVADSGPGLGQVPNTAGVVRSGSAPKPARKRPAPPTRAKGSRSENVGTPRRRDPALDALADRLTELEQAKRDATLTLPDGSKLDVTNLAKIFWPTAGLTKGDLLRYYVRVSPWLLPAVADRPLVMKRLPNGIKGKAFYQQRAPDDVPPGVRVDRLADDGEPDGSMPRLVGGTLQTLLYMTQLAAISQDPWFSRVQAPEIADYVALDLDPDAGRRIPSGARRGALAPRRSRAARRTRRAQDVRLLGTPCLHSAAARDALRIGAAALSNLRHTRVDEASQAGDRRAGRRQARPDGVRRLPPEHPGQDARDRLQRARERVRGRVDAPHLGRGRGRCRARRLHRQDGRAALRADAGICGHRSSQARRSICTACWSGWRATRSA